MLITHWFFTLDFSQNCSDSNMYIHVILRCWLLHMYLDLIHLVCTLSCCHFSYIFDISLHWFSKNKKYPKLTTQPACYTIYNPYYCGHQAQDQVWTHFILDRIQEKPFSSYHEDYSSYLRHYDHSNIHKCLVQSHQICNSW